MSMFNEIVCGEKGNAEKCESNSREVANYARRFPCGHWSFLGLGSEKKWYGTYSDKSDGVWDKNAEDMMLEFAETIHPMFRASSALERGELRRKGGSKKTVANKTSNLSCARLFLQTTQYLRRNSRYVQGGIQRSSGET